MWWDIHACSREYREPGIADPAGTGSRPESSVRRKAREMSYKLTANKEIGIMELRVRDSSPKEEVAEAMKMVSRLSAETGIELLLVDARKCDSMPSIVDVFELTSRFSHSMKMAVLLPAKNDVVEKLQFGETVGINRGIPIHLFESESEAIDWLKD